MAKRKRVVKIAKQSNNRIGKANWNFVQVLFSAAFVEMLF